MRLIGFLVGVLLATIVLGGCATTHGSGGYMGKDDLMEENVGSAPTLEEECEANLRHGSMCHVVGGKPTETSIAHEHTVNLK